MLSEEELRQALLELAQQPEISEKETLEVRALVRRSISRHRSPDDIDERSTPRKDLGFPLTSDEGEGQSSQDKSSRKKRPPRGTDK
jgi:hypothetical protein